VKITPTTTTFIEAIRTMNRALKANADKPPYKQLIEAGSKLAEGVTIGAGVYADDASNPHDYYTLEFKDGQIELIDHGKKDIDIDWRVPEDYLKKLAEDPDRYIDNPALLDWDWLKSRVGL
jgi:hypothetical protein